MLLGSHTCLPEAGVRPTPNVRGEYIYCHSPESWKDLWNGTVFKKGTVEVTAELRKGTGMVKDEVVIGPAKKEGRFMLYWTVKRI